jgi:hypothetical protein
VEKLDSRQIELYCISKLKFIYLSLRPYIEAGSTLGIFCKHIDGSVLDSQIKARTAGRPE